MAGLIVEIPAAVDPVSLVDMKNFLRVDNTDDDVLIGSMITAATGLAETFTRRSFVAKGFLETLDAFPYFTTDAVTQQAYPPSSQSLPRYATTQWNYSQMIKLFRPPLISVQRIAYISAGDQQWHSLVPAPPIWYPDTNYPAGFMVTDGNGNVQIAQNDGNSGDNPPTWARNINQFTNDTGPLAGSPAIPLMWKNFGAAPTQQFIVDAISEPGRIFPGPAGATWPPVMFMPDAVQIHYTAGYGLTGDSVPKEILMAIMQSVSHWYENRDAVAQGNWTKLPNHCEALLWSKRCEDFQPTRG